MEWRLGAWRGGLGGGGVEGERDTISLILWPLRGVACTSCSKPWTCSKDPVAVQSRGPVQRSLLLFKAVDVFKGACCCSKPWTCSKEPVAVQSRGPVQRSLLPVQSRGRVQRSLLPVQSRGPVQRSLLLFKAVDLFKGDCCCQSRGPVQRSLFKVSIISSSQ